MARILTETKGFANVVPDEKRETRVIRVVRVVCVPLTTINYHLLRLVIDANPLQVPFIQPMDTLVNLYLVMPAQCV